MSNLSGFRSSGYPIMLVVNDQRETTLSMEEFCEVKVEGVLLELDLSAAKPQIRTLLANNARTVWAKSVKKKQEEMFNIKRSNPVVRLYPSESNTRTLYDAECELMQDVLQISAPCNRKVFRRSELISELMLSIYKDISFNRSEATSSSANYYSASIGSVNPVSNNGSFRIPDLQNVSPETHCQHTFNNYVVDVTADSDSVCSSEVSRMEVSDDRRISDIFKLKSPVRHRNSSGSRIFEDNYTTASNDTVWSLDANSASNDYLNAHFSDSDSEWKNLRSSETTLSNPYCSNIDTCDSMHQIEDSSSTITDENITIKSDIEETEFGRSTPCDRNNSSNVNVNVFENDSEIDNLPDSCIGPNETWMYQDINRSFRNRAQTQQTYVQSAVSSEYACSSQGASANCSSFAILELDSLEDDSEGCNLRTSHTQGPEINEPKPYPGRRIREFISRSTTQLNLIGNRRTDTATSRTSRCCFI